MSTVTKMTANTHFHSAGGKQLSPEQVAREIVDYISEDTARRYRITIGTDSTLMNDQTADFVTAIVVHRVGNGGRYFWRRDTIGTFHTLRDRIIKEVLISLDMGKAVLQSLQDQPELRDSENWEFEIHADIGENGKTAEMLQEVVGMIRAYNFTPQTKPASYAASSVADRHV